LAGGVGEDGARADERFAMRYWRPDAKLAPYVSGYHLYSIRLEPGERVDDVFFPAWINIRFTLDADPWRVRFGRRLFDPVPSAALFGPTSHAGYSNGGSGILIGAGITPAGWARLFARNASLLADRVVPLEQLLGADALRLRARLDAGASPAETFDHWLLDRLDGSVPEAPEVGTLFAALGDSAVDTVAALEERLGVAGRALNRLSRVSFGFTPKLLLRRARFMRALMGAVALGRGRWSEAIGPAGYYDQSHFLRDCRLFLDMPLGEFVGRRKPLAELSMKLRTERLGAPAQALHRPARDLRNRPNCKEFTLFTRHLLS
jgi:hypothetical protein